MATGAAKLQWDVGAVLWALTANLNRDPKEKPEPFLPSDIHPYRTAADYQAEETCKKARDAIKRTCKVRKLKYGSVTDSGGTSVPSVVRR